MMTEYHNDKEYLKLVELSEAFFRIVDNVHSDANNYRPKGDVISVSMCK